NFYAEFLAALQVSENYSAYFGPLDFDSPFEMDAVPLKRALPWTQATKQAGIPGSELAQMNPALLSPVTRGKRPIPAGYELRVPSGRGAMMRGTLPPVAGAAGTRARPPR